MEVSISLEAEKSIVVDKSYKNKDKKPLTCLATKDIWWKYFVSDQSAAVGPDSGQQRAREATNAVGYSSKADICRSSTFIKQAKLIFV